MITGARILKTGIAVTISMYVCNFFHIQPSLFASAAAVLNLQSSLGKSLHNALEQLLAHFTSISIAIILGLTLGAHPLTMGLSTILVIIICNRFKWRGGLSGGIMATIFVLASPPDQFLNHALIRSIAIFIGVGSALIVNATIAPPRYEEPLSLKLNELNKFISHTFSEAVQCYLQLIVLPPNHLEELEKKVGKIFDEVHQYYDLYRYDFDPLKRDEKNGYQVTIELYREYLTYNKGLWQRTKDIFFLAQERIKRRENAGNLPISNEFKQILQLINIALNLFIRFNAELQGKIAGGIPDYADEPHIWSKLDVILNQWHSNISEGNYYLHALVEVSLITYKIRWAAKESVRLLDLNNI